MLGKTRPDIRPNRAKILLTLVSCFFWGGARFPTKLAQKTLAPLLCFSKTNTNLHSHSVPALYLTTRAKARVGGNSCGQKLQSSTHFFRDAHRHLQCFKGSSHATQTQQTCQNMSVPCSCLSMQAVQCRRQRQSHRQADRQRVEGRGEGKGGQGQAQRGQGREGQGVPQAAPGIHPRSRTRSPHGRCHAPRGSGGT